MGNRKETLEGIQRLVRRSQSTRLPPEKARNDTPKILDDLRSMSHTLGGSTERGLRRVKRDSRLQGRMKDNYMKTLGALVGNVNQTHPDTDEGVEKIAKRGLLEATKKKKKLTGASFERSIVTPGAKKSTRSSGAQTPDVNITTKKGKINAEAKAGSHIDFEQMTVSGGTQRNKKGKITKVGLNRPVGKTATRSGKMLGKITGYTAKKIRRGLTGRSMNPGTTHRGKPISALAQAFTGRKKEVKNKIANKHGHALLHQGGDPVHVHHNTKTGEIAVVPVSDKHKKHTKAMGLHNQPSIEQIANHPEERRSSMGFKFRARRKERRASASFGGDSHKIVDAVKRHGGQVFKNHKEYQAHMKKHGVKVGSGHAN